MAYTAEARSDNTTTLTIDDSAGTTISVFANSGCATNATVATTLSDPINFGCATNAI
jgi:hypothetical protein